MSLMAKRIRLSLVCFGLAWCMGWLLRSPSQAALGPEMDLAEEEHRLFSGEHYLIHRNSLLGAGERAADLILRRWRREGVQGCAGLKDVDLRMRPKIVSIRRGPYANRSYLGSGVLLAEGRHLLTSKAVCLSGEDRDVDDADVQGFEIAMDSGRPIAISELVAQGEGHASWVILSLKGQSVIEGVSTISCTPLQPGERLLALSYRSGMGVPARAMQGWMESRFLEIGGLSAMRLIAEVGKQGSIRVLAGTDLGDERGGPVFNDAGDLVGLIASLSSQGGPSGLIQGKLDVLRLDGLEEALEALR